MKIFSPREVARKLKYNDDSTVRKLISKGQLKARKIGKQWVITDKDLMAFNGRTLVVIEGGLIGSEDNWRYYFGEFSSPKLTSGIYIDKIQAEKSLATELQASKDNYKGSPQYVVVLKKKADIYLNFSLNQ